MNADELKNIGSHEVVVLLDGSEPDSQGKQVFTAFWRDDHFPGNPGPPLRVRGQVFRMVLSEFIESKESQGKTVRKING
jgi:hypothetical protein